MILVFLTYLAYLYILTTAAGITHHQMLMSFIFLLWLSKCLEILNIQLLESKKLLPALLF